MRHGRALVLLLTAIWVVVDLSGCGTPEQAPGDRAKGAASMMEVPVIPEESSVINEQPPADASGEVPERGVTGVAPGTVLSETAVVGSLPSPSPSGYPGEFAFRTP